MGSKHNIGFTLIELSIVLVIIGLIVGGVLVGQDLIGAAEVRAQISQIEKYSTAVNTFRLKYAYLPGDIPDPAASGCGFFPRGTFRGQGDGNGLLEGVFANAVGQNDNQIVFGGETEIFWVDLSQAGLLDGSFSNNRILAPSATVLASQVASYFPTAKLGKGNYIYVSSGGTLQTDNINYFDLSTVIGGGSGYSTSNISVPVWQAYSIDQKIDDGLPQYGRVTASYLKSWAIGGSNSSFGATATGDSEVMGGPVKAGDSVATTGSANTCYDNGHVAGATEQYSMSQRGGAGLNCALSFKFQ